jgi:hypothetical protein
MKKTTLSILGGAAVATALFLSSNTEVVQPPTVPMFSMEWENNYANSNLVSLVIASDKAEAPISEWVIIAQTQDGRYSEPRTNGNRFYAVVNYDPDKCTFSLPW